MADSILRLRVESSEYDSKLKKAAEGIQHLAQVAYRGGGSITEMEKAEIEFIKALGDMETQSRSASGKLREMESAYKNLAATYNQLSAEQQNDAGGKALAASLEKLRQRTLEAKDAMDKASDSLKNAENKAEETGGIMEQLAQKMVINVDATKLLDAGLKACKAALDVAKDAFFASESGIDEWGSAVKQAEGAYDVFLQTLNNGNWSDFFSNLNSAISGARDLYSALDRLGSVKSNNQAAIALQQQQIAQLRLMKQQGKNVDDQLKRATENLRNLQNQSVAAGKNAGATMVGQAIRNGYNTQSGSNAISGGTVDAVVKDIMKNGQGAFDRYKKQYERLTKAGTTTRHSNYGGSDVNYSAFDINNLTKEQQKQYRLAKAITERETEIQKGISVYAQAVQDGTNAAREEFKGNRYAAAGSGNGGRSGSGNKKTDVVYAEDSIMAQEKLVQDLTQKWRTASEEMRGGYLEQLEAAKEKLAEMQGKGKGPDTSAYTFTESQLESVTMPSVPTIRGNDGKAQDKLDLATAAFATSGTSNVDFSNYTSALQNAIKDADLGSDLYNSLTEKLQDASTMSAVLQGAIAGGVSGADMTSIADELKRKLLEGDISEDAWQEMLDKINEKITDSDLKLTFNVDTKSVETAVEKQKRETNEMAKEWQNAGNAIQAVGQAMNAIEDPAAKVLGTVAQAVASIALGYAQASTQAAAMGPWAWIAFAATGLATMISMVNGVHQATGFADGGIVKGNTYSGDQIPAMLNAGEVVLNAAQTSNVAQSLEGNGMQNLSLSTEISGEDIRIALNNNGRRTGRGEFVQTNRRQ